MSREFSKSVVQKLVEAGYVAYWAGGCVRDLIRGVEAQDYDVATNATPEDVRSLFGARQTYAVGESFGVIIVLGPRNSGASVEVATFRKESDYTDGRHPDNVEFTTAEEDAKRRDFTINGMFYDPLNGVLHDYVGGQEDLQQGVIRAIGDPSERMREDKLRMLRAVRFAARFGFAIEPATKQAIIEMADQISVVSVERIAQELRKMLVDSARTLSMRLSQELGLMDVILPETVRASIQNRPVCWEQILLALNSVRTKKFESGMAILLWDAPQFVAVKSKAIPIEGTVHAACNRLKLSNAEKEAIVWLTAHQAKVQQIVTEPICEFKKLAAHRLFGELVEIHRAKMQVQGKEDVVSSFVEQKLASIPADELNPPPLINGADLIATGLKSGPYFKRYLEAARDAQLNNEIHTKDEALSFVQSFDFKNLSS